MSPRKSDGTSGGPWWSIRGVVLVVMVLVVVVVVEAEVGDYTHDWAVQISGGDREAEVLAARHDYKVVTKIFDDVYLLRHQRLARRSADPSHIHHHRLITEPIVLWAEQQVVKRRVKRDLDNHQRSLRSTITFNDPKWSEMWYLNRGGSLDMNVRAAWQEGVTGKGIVVTILDDGIETNHSDLVSNYDPNASYDLNNEDSDPTPRYEVPYMNSHGTRCAGVVAAVGNNSICSIGVAYEASIGGVRMLDGVVTDALEAKSLSLKPQHIDIYSASWGPDDDGRTVDGAGTLTTRAFKSGIRDGRGGKGSIFVWASGNGGRYQDNCNCDGYTTNIWTLTVSSVSENGNVPWYAETCSSILTTTYSSGSTSERQIITTDLHHSCTNFHTGSSGSAPLAAGICALALQVNQELTWRDMQHIVVRTSRSQNLEAPDWQVNGVGRKFSHWYGFGLMDAHEMVKLARNWTNVSPQKRCEVAVHEARSPIPEYSGILQEKQVVDCPGMKSLEHVQAKVTLTADKRGNIKIYLTSPAGTRSTLLTGRSRDSSRSGFTSWLFMTVHMWGEQPLGTWTLEIHNTGQGKAEIVEWSMIMYGNDLVMEQITMPPLEETSTTINPGITSLPTVTVPDTINVINGTSDSSQVTPSPASHNLSTGCGCIDASKSCLQCLQHILSCSDHHSIKKRETQVKCSKGQYLVDGQCVASCSEGLYGSVADEGSHLTCRPCHYTCRTCSGAEADQCGTCWSHAELHTPAAGRHFCQPRDLLNAYQNQQWWNRVMVVTVVVMVAVVVLLEGVIIYRISYPSQAYQYLSRDQCK